MLSVVSGTGVHNAQRLATLRSLELLDRPPDPAFDRLARLAARLLRVPIALVSLVDEHRQVFQSCVGLPEPWATRRETPLSHSFCQYVVDTGAPLVVTDAPSHPLVCANVAIADLHVHAYLGIPLVTTDGMVLGSLCAIDTVPHAWDQADMDVLRDLAAAVMTEIEWRRDIRSRQRAEADLYESNARFAGAFTHASIGMALVAPNGQWLQVNEALCALVGYSAEELLATTFQQITHPDDLDIDVAHMQQMLHGDISTYQIEKRYIHKHGHMLWIVLNVSLVRDMHGTPQYFVSQIQDISARHQYEWERHRLIEQLVETLDEREALLEQMRATLRRTEALYAVAGTLNQTQAMDTIFQTVVEQASAVLPAHRTVLITFDMDTRVVTHQCEGGPGAMDVPPLSFAEVWEGLSGVVVRDGQPVYSVQGAVDDRESPAVRQRRQHDQAGSILVVPIQSQGTMLGTLTAINAPDGPDFTPGDMNLLSTLAHHAAMALERTMLLAELHHHATTDGLTQLLNRRCWVEQSQRSMALAERSGRPLSVVLLDVDHFKQINDTYGHVVGDQVLHHISQLLQRTVRQSDLVGRYGGEEFVILLPDTDAPMALGIAERIRRALASHPLPVDQHHLAITASLGLATVPDHARDLATLVMAADHALYAAKRAGRNCVRLAQTDAQTYMRSA